MDGLTRHDLNENGTTLRTLRVGSLHRQQIGKQQRANWPANAAPEQQCTGSYQKCNLPVFVYLVGRNVRPDFLVVADVVRLGLLLAHVKSFDMSNHAMKEEGLGAENFHQKKTYGQTNRTIDGQ